MPFVYQAYCVMRQALLTKQAVIPTFVENEWTSLSNQTSRRLLSKPCLAVLLIRLVQAVFS